MFRYAAFVTTTIVTMAIIFAIAISMPTQHIYASVDHPDDNINRNALRACEHTDKPQFCPSVGPGDDDDDDNDGGGSGPPDP